MLYLVGLGLWDEQDITLKGIQACKKSGRVYAELYTSAWGGDIKKLEKLIGKKIRVIGRSALAAGATLLAGRNGVDSPGHRGPANQPRQRCHLRLRPFRAL